MTVSSLIERPELTLPVEEAGYLRAAYEQARVILEYGSGGSTVMAAEMAGKTVFSVESDKDWALKMRDWFDQNPPAKGTMVDVIWSDVGPTKAWGTPKRTDEYLKFAGYPLDIWFDSGFQQPDVVLVDGRFRPGCALAAAFLSTRPVKVLVDDYKRRKHYHRLEAYFGAPKLIGRMAAFDVEPRPVDPKDLKEIVGMMITP